MSGGSWDYVYFRIDEAAIRLMESRDPLRRALGKKMEKVSQAMHDIEWVDSCDSRPGSEIPAIKAALGDDYKKLAMKELIEEHEQLIKKWEELVNG